jgi:hypothetical protein
MVFHHSYISRRRELWPGISLQNFTPGNKILKGPSLLIPWVSKVIRLRVYTLENYSLIIPWISRVLSLTLGL